MGKKNSKLEIEYSRLSGMSDEQIDVEKTKVEIELANINSKIKDLTEKVTVLSVEIESSKDSEKEEDKAAIATKTAKRDKLNEVLEEAKKEKEKITKKSERVQGFIKNKVAIQRIIAYKDKFIAQEKALKDQKASNEYEIAGKKQTIENIEKTINNAKLGISCIELDLKKIDLELENIKEDNSEEASKSKSELIKKISNLETEKTRKIKEIEMYEEQQGKLKQRISILEKKNEDIDKKLEIIAVAISKCNFAWTSLFNNKTWDQIQAQSLDGRFTRNKAKEAELKKGEEKPVEETKAQESAEKTATDEVKIESPEEKATAGNPIGIKPEEIEEQPEAEEPGVPAKKSRFQSFLSAVRHPVQTVKSWMQNRKNKKEEEKESEENKPEEKKTEEKESEEKTEHSTENQRDAFLAQLQKMVERPETNIKEGLQKVDEAGRKAEAERMAKEQADEDKEI